MKFIRFLLHFLLCGFNIVDGSFLSWIFGGGSSSDSNDISEGGGREASTMTGQPSAMRFGRAPFEMKSAEQRFLKAGEEYMAGLSELDTCHHRV